MSINEPTRNAGLRRIELLLIIATVGAVLALILPAVQVAREASRRSSCGNNMKQLGIALHNYHDTYKSFPPEAIWLGNPKGTLSTVGDQRNFTWCSLIPPFIESQDMHDQVDFSKPAIGQSVLQRSESRKRTVKSARFSGFYCPSDEGLNSADDYWGYSVTSYAGNGGWDGRRRSYADPSRAGPMSLMDSVSLSDFKDGTANTILLGEVTTSGFCSRPKGAAKWDAGSGKIRGPLKSRVARTMMVADSPWIYNSDSVLAAGQGELRRADGSSGSLWAHSKPYLLSPVYYYQYAMNVEWPGPGSRHPGGANFTMADASVRFISETISTGDGDDLGRNGNIWAAAHTYKGDAVQDGAEATIVWP